VRALVTGATGFVGANVARVLVEQGHSRVGAGSTDKRSQRTGRLVGHAHGRKPHGSPVAGPRCPTRRCPLSCGGRLPVLGA
jgi:nucleoside-diphosphate-sugar epimerase